MSRLDPATFAIKFSRTVPWEKIDIQLHGFEMYNCTSK